MQCPGDIRCVGGEPPCPTPGAGPISWPAPRPPPASLPPLALFPGRQHAWTFSSVPAPNTRPPPATISLRLPSPLGSPVSDLCLPPSLSPNSFFDHLQADFSVATKKVPLEVPGLSKPQIWWPFANMFLLGHFGLSDTLLITPFWLRESFHSLRFSSHLFRHSFSGSFIRPTYSLMTHSVKG